MGVKNEAIDDEPDFETCENINHEDEDADDYVERGDLDGCDDCRTIREDWANELIEAARDAIDSVEVP